MHLWVFIDSILSWIKMKILSKLLLLFLIGSTVFSAMWPVGVNQKDIIGTKAGSYSAITNLKIVNGYSWSDNSWIYTVANGQISLADYSMISKYDGQLNVVWKRTLPGLIKFFLLMYIIYFIKEINKIKNFTL